MARSGSTLICKCLGCMEGVALLSEQHPKAWNLFNPLTQAEAWFQLITPSEFADMKKKGVITFIEAITLIEERCRARGLTLVLRDWAHLDYTGLPFVATPGYRPLLYTALSENFDIIRISTTRDPVTQWQSLVKLPMMHKSIQSGALSLGQFLVGYRKYAELCVETGFIRYEDFVRNPEMAMRKMCEHLEIKFDPEFANKWYVYKKISGDIIIQRNSNEIKMPPIRPIEPDLRRKFLASADYHRSCELLGYEPLAK